VTRRQGYRFRLKPTQAEAALLRRFVGCSRFVWNELVALNELRHERGEMRLGYSAMCGCLRYLKGEHPFLREVHSQPLQQTLKDLAIAYQRAFDPTLSARFPRFKKLGRAQGIRFPLGFVIDGCGVYLPKIGWIGFRKSREMAGAPKNVTVSCDGSHWYLTIQTQREVDEPVHASDSAVGIDLGVARFAALSDGTFVEGSNAFKKNQKRLAFYQRRMARKVRFSANWRKAKAKVSRLQRKITNIRNDILHKASTTISQNHAVVVLEDLRITHMTASAKGTVEQPGKNVRVKSGLNRRILDVSSTTSSHGTAARYCSLIRVIQAVRARIVAMSAARTGRLRQHSNAWRAVTRPTRTRTPPSISSEGPGRSRSPVEIRPKADRRSRKLSMSHERCVEESSAFRPGSMSIFFLVEGLDDFAGCFIGAIEETLDVRRGGCRAGLHGFGARYDCVLHGVERFGRLHVREIGAFASVLGDRRLHRFRAFHSVLEIRLHLLLAFGGCLGKFFLEFSGLLERTLHKVVVHHSSFAATVRTQSTARAYCSNSRTAPRRARRGSSSRSLVPTKRSRRFT
jgi:putative transposase